MFENITNKIMSHIVYLEVVQLFDFVPICILLSEKKVNNLNYYL